MNACVEKLTESTFKAFQKVRYLPTYKEICKISENFARTKKEEK